MNDEISEYADRAIAEVSAPEEFKYKLKENLVSYIIQASKYTSVDNVITNLGQPKELSSKINHELYGKSTEFLDRIMKKGTGLKNVSGKSCSECTPTKNYRDCTPKRYWGEYEREESRVNIKLLYIPLIQIDSGIERIRMPIVRNEPEEWD